MADNDRPGSDGITEHRAAVFRTVHRAPSTVHCFFACRTVHSVSGLCTSHFAPCTEHRAPSTEHRALYFGHLAPRTEHQFFAPRTSRSASNDAIIDAHPYLPGSVIGY